MICWYALYLYLPEAVLSLLLESFAYSETEHKIRWNISGVIYPTVFNPGSGSDVMVERHLYWC